MNTMDIYAEPGTKVRFAFPNNGYDFHKETAKQHLIEGEIYTVKITDVGSFHTDVYLQEVPGVKFNSVMFENV